jgi:hypothetical protein
MKFVHGPLRFELPDGWEDRSTLVFCDPQTLVAPQSTKASPGAAPPNVVLTMVRPGKGSLSEFLERELQTGIAPKMPGFEVVERGDAGSVEQPVPFVVYRANPGQMIRQLVAARLVGEQVALLTAGALEAQFAALKPKALATLLSVQKG